MVDEKKGFSVNDQRWWLKEDADLEGMTDKPPSTQPTYVEELETRLAEKDKTLREYIQAHKSSLADLDGARERIERELERRLGIERARLAGPFLEVQDNLLRLLSSCRELGAAPELVAGVELTIKQLLDRLSDLGLEPVPTVGQRFDPRSMEALLTTPVDRDKDGVVLEEIRPGFRLGEHLVRPAGVRVGVAGKE